MQQNLSHALQLILQSEGGFVDDPRDPGGATKFGITLRTLAAWRAPKGVTADDVRLLTQEDAAAIYRKEYATPIRFEDLPEGVDYVVLDCAVNSGPARAAKILQSVLGVSADGVIGAMTLAALDGRATADVINDYTAARLAFMRALPTWQTFGRGWAARVACVEHDALEMATGADYAHRPIVPPIATAKAREPAQSWLSALIALFRGTTHG